MKRVGAALCALAMLAAAPSPALAALPPGDAPYDTKMTCVAFHSLIANIYGEDSPEGAEAARRTERWIEAALAEKSGDEAVVTRDVEEKITVVLARMGAASEEEQMNALLRLIEEMRGQCAPYEE